MGSGGGMEEEGASDEVPGTEREEKKEVGRGYSGGAE
jgi:hypothetical protein